MKRVLLWIAAASVGLFPSLAWSAEPPVVYKAHDLAAGVIKAAPAVWKAAPGTVDLKSDDQKCVLELNDKGLKPKNDGSCDVIWRSATPPPVVIVKGTDEKLKDGKVELTLKPAQQGSAPNLSLEDKALKFPGKLPDDAEIAVLVGASWRAIKKDPQKGTFDVSTLEPGSYTIYANFDAEGASGYAMTTVETPATTGGGNPGKKPPSLADPDFCKFNLAKDDVDYLICVDLTEPPAVPQTVRLYAKNDANFKRRHVLLPNVSSRPAPS